MTLVHSCLVSKVMKGLSRKLLPAAVAVFVVLSALTVSGTSSASAQQPFEVVTTISVNYSSELVVSGDHAYVASGSAISVINTSTNTVVHTIGLSGTSSPDGAAAIGDKVYFADRSNNKIIILDTRTRTVSYLDTTGCTTPSQLRAINATRLIVNCQDSGNVQVYDVTVPTIAGTVTTGSQPRGMSVNAGLVFVPNSGSDTVTVVNAAATPPVALSTELVGDQPEFTAYLDGKIYSANYRDNTVSIIDGSTYSVLTTVPVGNNPQGIEPCVGNTYTANRWTGNTSVISPTTNTVINTIALAGTGAITHVMGVNGNYAYFLNHQFSSLNAVDCSTQTAQATVPLTHRPAKIAFSSQFAYITTPGTPGTISVLSLPRSSTTSVTASATGTYVDFQFFTPDGHECTDISPVRVRVGTLYELPGVDASCRTMPGATVAGWTVPGPPGFTGYGSPDMAFPPGLPVLVIESQRFTVVPKEPVLQIDYDSNIADHDACDSANKPHTSRDGRIEHVWIPREDVSRARIASSASCVPYGHRLVGWNTAGDGRGTTFSPGAIVPAEWADMATNTRHLFAMWAPTTP